MTEKYKNPLWNLLGFPIIARKKYGLFLYRIILKIHYKEETQTYREFIEFKALAEHKFKPNWSTIYRKIFFDSTNEFGIPELAYKILHSQASSLYNNIK